MPTSGHESADERLASFGERIRVSAHGVRRISRDSNGIFEEMRETAIELYKQYVTWRLTQDVGEEARNADRADIVESDEILQFISCIIYSENPQASIDYSDQADRMSNLETRVMQFGGNLKDYVLIARWWHRIGKRLTRDG